MKTLRTGHRIIRTGVSRPGFGYQGGGGGGGWRPPPGGDHNPRAHYIEEVFHAVLQGEIEIETEEDFKTPPPKTVPGLLAVIIKNTFRDVVRQGHASKQPYVPPTPTPTPTPPTPPLSRTSTEPERQRGGARDPLYHVEEAARHQLEADRIQTEIDRLNRGLAGSSRTANPQNDSVAATQLHCSGLRPASVLAVIANKPNLLDQQARQRFHGADAMSPAMIGELNRQDVASIPVAESSRSLDAVLSTYALLHNQDSQLDSLRDSQSDFHEDSESESESGNESSSDSD